MNCQRCGNAIIPGDAVCRVCGTPVPNNNVASAPVQNNAAPAVPGAMNFVQSPANAPQVDNGLGVNSQPVTGSIPATSISQSAPQMQPQAMPVNNPASVPQQVAPTPINQVPPVMPQQQVVNQTPMAQQPVMNNVTTGTEPLQEDVGEKKKSPVMIIVLVLVLLGVVAFDVIFFVKPFDKKTEPVPEEQIPEESEVYTSWMDYILEQNISSITLERTTDDKSGDKTVTLTKENLMEIFSTLAAYSLEKEHLNSNDYAIGDTLLITYKLDDVDYEIKIASGVIIADPFSLRDNELRTLIDAGIDNDELKDDDNVLYKFIDYDGTIFDEYLTAE